MNSMKDDPCNYGYFAAQIGLAEDKYVFDCNKVGTHAYEGLFFCDEHYPKVKK